MNFVRQFLEINDVKLYTLLKYDLTSGTVIKLKIRKGAKLIIL